MIDKPMKPDDAVPQILHQVWENTDTYDDAMNMLAQCVLALNLMLLKEDASGNIYKSKYACMSEDNGKAIRLSLSIDVIGKEEVNVGH